MTTPLDEFEFQHDAEIRKPAAPKVSRDDGTGTGRWPKLAVIILSIALIVFAGYHIHKSRTHAIETAELQQHVQELAEQSTSLQGELESVRTALASLNSQFATSRKGKEELLTSINKLKNSLDDRDNRITELRRTEKALRTEIDKLKQDRLEQQERLKQQDETIRSHVKALAEKETIIQSLERRNRDNTDRISVLESERNKENSASRQIVSSMLEKDREIASLQQQLKAEQEKNRKLDSENTRLKDVREGDLVPLSDRVTPAHPMVHPPVILEGKGLFGKASGFVMVIALIDHVGQVENAAFMEHHLQHVESPQLVVSKALRTVMQWKFSPALYDTGVRVRVWQPVLVPVTAR